MKRMRLRLVVLGLWAIIMVLFVRYEAYSEYFTRSLDGYRSLIPGDVMVRDSWMRLVFRGVPIGYSHTAIGLEEEGTAHLFDIRNRTFLKLKLLGREQRLHMDSSAVLDVAHSLLRFRFSLRSRAEGGGYSLTVTGERRDRRSFDVTMDTPGGQSKILVAVPDNVVLYSPLAEMAMRDLTPGREFTLRTLDPASMTPVALRVRALRRESIVFRGAEQPATVVETDYRGMTFLSWVARDGQVLRQETPFGWTLEACTPEEALLAVSRSAAAEDATVESRLQSFGKDWGAGFFPAVPADAGGAEK